MTDTERPEVPPERVRELLEGIVASAYGVTWLPSGRKTTTVDATLVQEAADLLGFETRVGIECEQ